MNTANCLRLLALAAIWGGSFLFMRIGVPVLGPVLLIAARVGFGALFLLLASRLLRKPLQLRAHWRHYLIIGFFNSALPFLLFAIAARTLPVSQLSVLNATAPIWGAVIGAVMERRGLAPKTVLGLALGLVGVAILMGIDNLQAGAANLLAMACGLSAAFCYGIATQYAKSARKVEPFANAHGSMWAATVLLLPAVPAFPAISTPSVEVLLAVLALGVVCSGRRIGPDRHLPDTGVRHSLGSPVPRRSGQLAHRTGSAGSGHRHRPGHRLLTTRAIRPPARSRNLASEPHIASRWSGRCPR